MATTNKNSLLRFMTFYHYVNVMFGCNLLGEPALKMIEMGNKPGTLALDGVPLINLKLCRTHDGLQF